LSWSSLRLIRTAIQHARKIATSVFQRRPSEVCTGKVALLAASDDYLPEADLE
jgi:hypothetical protein